MLLKNVVKKKFNSSFNIENPISYIVHWFLNVAVEFIF